MRETGTDRLRRAGVALAIAGALAASAAARQADRPRIEVRDGFEAADLGDSWSAMRFLPGAVRIQSEVVRSGARAVLITLRPGDQVPGETGTELERAELMEAPRLASFEGAAYRYAFSLFLPRDFPVVPTRLVLAQWKQFCPSGACRPDNPVFALRYRSGEFQVTLRTGPKTRTLFRTTDEIRGRWLDFVFVVKFSREEDGRAEASMNGRRIFEYEGPTAYSSEFGYPAEGRFYFKTGLYRDRSPEEMRVFVDDYEKAEFGSDGGKR